MKVGFQVRSEEIMAAVFQCEDGVMRRMYAADKSTTLLHKAAFE